MQPAKREISRDTRNVAVHVWIYVVSAIVALYLNVFVAVFQAFLKIAPVHDLAPTQKEPPFAIAQGIVLLAFIALGYLAVRRFRPSPGPR